MMDGKNEVNFESDACPKTCLRVPYRVDATRMRIWRSACGIYVASAVETITMLCMTGGSKTEKKF
jgi:hypothetical protein